MGKSMNQIVLCIALCLILLFVFTGCEDDTSNMDPKLLDLVEAYEQGKAEKFALQENRITLVDGKVLVTIEPEPNKVTKARAAVCEYGGTVETMVSKSGSFGAYVPIDSLIPLIQKNISAIL